MTRTNSEGQSDRTKEGRDFEGTVSQQILILLERNNLDESFIICSKRQKNYNRNWFSYRLPGSDHDTRVNVDIVIYPADSSIPVVLIGCKRSFRERIYQDVLHAIFIKYQFPEAMWIEIFERENDKDSLAKTMKQAKNNSYKFNGPFAAVLSTRLVDHLYAFYDGILIQHLKSTIERRLAGGPTMPKPRQPHHRRAQNVT